MDVLIRQLWTKYAKGGKEDGEGSSTATARDQKLQPQKTQSFKGEKKRTQSWLRRQFSTQMRQDYDSGIGGEYEIAVAAAAFAVKSLEETRTTDEISKPNLDAQDRKVQISTETSEKKPEKAGGLVPALKKKLSFGDGRSPPESALAEEKTIGPLLPSIKKAPTFTDKNLDRTPTRKPESTEPKPDFPTLKQPQFQPVDSTRQSPTKPGLEDNTADAWEKAELARIKEKYEKLNTTILDWENKRKKKAKHKLERIEAELDKRRAKALQHHHSELARIDRIAGGARSQAIENRRNEELKVKEKANKIRLTGKVPVTCLCC